MWPFPVFLHPALLGVPLESHTILLTGVTGSFGSAMLRHLLRTSTCTIRGMSRSELLQAQLIETLTLEERSRVRLLLGDVRDYQRLLVAMRGVDIVYHAAALKRVDSGEYDPVEFVRSNIGGTEHVALACIESGVKRAVFLSSDKSSNPINLYGATKMVGERLWIRANSYSPYGTHFIVTRYGNVTGSRGSVFGTWQRCLEAGTPLPITHPEMTRFWISLDEAVALAQFAAAHGPRGSILVPHLKAYAVTDLAAAFLGEPVTSASCTSIGIRPGEKFHETLIADHEASRVTAYLGENVVCPRYYAIAPEAPSWHNGASYGVTWHPHQVLDPYESGAWPYRMLVPELRAQLQTIGILL